MENAKRPHRGGFPPRSSWFLTRPRSITGLGAAVSVERLVERKIPCL